MGYFPTYGDYKIINNLPSSRAFADILKKENKTNKDFKIDIGYDDKYSRFNVIIKDNAIVFPLEMGDGTLIFLDNENNLNEIKNEYANFYD